MTTYVYETIPAREGEEPERFEIRQAMTDDPLKKHPDTGVPIRRVITGGFGYLATGDGAATPPSPVGGGGG